MWGVFMEEQYHMYETCLAIEPTYEQACETADKVVAALHKKGRPEMDFVYTRELPDVTADPIVRAFAFIERGRKGTSAP